MSNTYLSLVYPQGLLFMWEQSQDQSLRLYHAQRSYAGISLVILRILLAAMFAVKLKALIAAERSKLKRQFYSSFTKVASSLRVSHKQG